jgi:hypothetical protein
MDDARRRPDRRSAGSIPASSTDPVDNFVDKPLAAGAGPRRIDTWAGLPIDWADVFLSGSATCT